MSPLGSPRTSQVVRGEFSMEVTMRHLWNGEGHFGTPPKTYKTYANAVKAAHKAVGSIDATVIIAATVDGRFFPVAIGHRALSDGLHFRMCVAA